LTKRYPLIGGNTWKSVRDDFGVAAGTYCLRLWNDKLEGFSPIPRLLGTDFEGTLYIGTSGNLANRIGALKKAVSAAYRRLERYAADSRLEGYSDPTAHGAGRMISKSLANTFTFERLCVEVHTYPLVEGNAFNHYAEEWRLLSSYAERFGEFPPLNGLKPSHVAKG
jgi:hypothetical protein